MLAFAAAAAATAQTWYGMTPNAKGDPTKVDIVTLQDSGTITSLIASVQLGPGEQTWPDAFRCIKGFCLFSTTVLASRSSTSYVYNVSASNGALYGKNPCPGKCGDMHVDYSTGRAFVTSETLRSVIVTEVSNGKSVPILDITQAVGATGTVQATTHCSAGGHLYVGVNNAGVTQDFILDVDLDAGKIGNVIQLSIPIFDAMWSTCTGNGLIGGISYKAGSGNANGTATFGSVDQTGAYTPRDSVGVPAGFVPSGLITGTEDASTNIAPFYPPATPTNSTGQVSGYLWAVNPYGGSDDFVTEFSYYLIGAAVDA